jgi:hypothetical protein
MIPCSCVPDLIFPRVFWPRVHFGLLFFWHGSVIIWPGQSRHISSCGTLLSSLIFPSACGPKIFLPLKPSSFGSPQIPRAPEFLFCRDRFYFRAPVLILPPSARQDGLLLARPVRQAGLLQSSFVLQDWADFLVCAGCLSFGRVGQLDLI